MRIVVISDTHGNQSAIRRGLERIGAVEVVLHLGDHGADLAGLVPTSIETHAVLGNSDPHRNLPEELLLNFNGHTLFLCHGHRYGVKQGFQRLFYKGLDVGADIVLFGHTHRALNCQEEGVLLLNPGSAGKPYPGERASFAVLDLEPGFCNARIVEL